jgi:hypothetical protein
MTTTSIIDAAISASVIFLIMLVGVLASAIYEKWQSGRAK